jgi:hypothetical protein
MGSISNCLYRVVRITRNNSRATCSSGLLREEATELRQFLMWRNPDYDFVIERAVSRNFGSATSEEPDYRPARLEDSHHRQ